MDRLKGIGSFLVIALFFFLALRLLHVGIPIFYPQVPSGPYTLRGIAAVARYSGFSPRVPVYRPQQLGVRPVKITVTRRPQPRVVILWQAGRFLNLAQQRGGLAPRLPVAAIPLPGHPGASWWREGGAYHVILKSADLWIELHTDLSLEDVGRILDTLRPYEELL